MPFIAGEVRLFTPETFPGGAHSAVVPLKADGTAENLPTLSREDPEQQKRHSMELLRDAPMDMGLGIKREAPRHY